VYDLAAVTPVFYFVFLFVFLAFTVATYLFLSKTLI